MKPKIYAYIRVSRQEQKISRQIDELQKYVEDKKDIFIDHASGKNFERENYQKLRDMVQENDEIYVKSLDRFGRNKQLIKEELEYYKKKNVRVHILDIPTTMMDLGSDNTDIQDMVNNILIEVLGTIAQREREAMLKRQHEGFEAMHRRGIHVGRHFIKLPPNWFSIQQHYLRGRLRASEAMRLLGGMKSSTFYKYVRTPPERIREIQAMKMAGDENAKRNKKNP